MKFGRVILAVIFFCSAVFASCAYACGNKGNNTEGFGNKRDRGVMPDSGGCKGFKKPRDMGYNGEGEQKGEHQGRHRGWEQGEHNGDKHGKRNGWDHSKHNGRNKRGGSGDQGQQDSGSGADNQIDGSTDQGQQDSGSGTADNIDFSGYTDSESLLTKAWESYNGKDMSTASAFAQETVNRYSEQAKEQQGSLSGFASEGEESQYWALNDVATAHFILGSAYKAQGDNAKAAEQFNIILSDYKYAQCYDPQGWYWKVAEGAQTELEDL